MLTNLTHLITGAADLAAAFLFMYGLKRMSSPVSAPSGIRVAGYGMLVAILANFLTVFTVNAAAKPHLLVNIILAVVALSLGASVAWIKGRTVAMTEMPQMVALYNGLGGGAAGAIAAAELYGNKTHGTTQIVLALLGGLIGAVSLSGSAIAWAKLDEVLKKPMRFPGQRYVNAAFLLAALVMAGYIVFTGHSADAALLANPRYGLGKTVEWDWLEDGAVIRLGISRWMCGIVRVIRRGISRLSAARPRWPSWGIFCSPAQSAPPRQITAICGN